ncbi:MULTISPECIES: hypothetical protein [Paraburkholderia]|uniref:hypothetical protein n=1 Tax=Paraburkholderia TaxID=1822464 RepID=UPI00225561C8|nr:MULTISPECIES: hypothetical protein [Paraburkholderia]MCX4165708.1 hypothetical protein [Paraburkholderia megapolitana]MDN7161199.1 hypothetical protein [Paraburkholderia sp. CHISQ3]MDQ6498246.1 hypothetical protein [Paraburkholderia megapolitana]
MEWLEPWWSTQNMDESFHANFARQLGLEISPGHEMFGVRGQLIGRGQGDDALFELLDGSGRVAVVHLTWASSKQQPPWPITTIYANMGEWVEQCMLPEHEEWKN